MRPAGRTTPLDAVSRVAVFGDHVPAAQAAGTAAAEAELPAAEPPQPGDDWTDIANTPIRATGRRVNITDAMVKKFAASMGCPRCQNGTGVSSAHAQQHGVADPRRATDTRS